MTSHTTTVGGWVPLAAADDPTRLGRKAAGLARALSDGFPVPDGVVVPPDADLAGQSWAALLDRLGGCVAVRSSGLAEDTDRASYAGQYRTCLWISTPHELEAAVQRCRASTEGVAVRAYRERMGDATAAMAVLVQRMVRPDASGVAFAVDPVTGAEGVVIEAVAGVGDAAMDGTVTPERWRVKDHPNLDDAPAAPVLDPTAAERIARLCRELTTLGGGPVDVEWAIHDGTLHLLQVRPITRLPLEPSERPPAGQSWTREDRFAAPVTPLSSSAWLPIYERAFQIVFERLGMPATTIRSRRYYGRVYTRLEPIGGGWRDDHAPPAVLLGLLFRLLPPLRRRMATAAAYTRDRGVERAIDAWESGGRSRLRERRRELRTAEVASRDDAELAEHLDAVMRHVLDSAVAHFELSLSAGAVASGRLGMFVQEQLGWSPHQAIGLLQGHGPASTAHGDALRQLAREVGPGGIRRGTADPASLLQHGAVRRYLEQYGHRLATLDLSQPTEAENPGSLAAHLARYADAPEPTADPLAAASALEARARQQLSHELRSRFDDLLALARRGRPYGDETEADVLESLALVRPLALEAAERLTAAGRLDHADDVQFLDVDELARLLRDPSAATPDLDRRRREHLWALANPAPDRIGPPPPAPPPASAVPPPARPVVAAMLWSLTSHPTQPASDADASSLCGVPGSPGTATGPVRIVRSTSDFDRVRPGDVLVCPTTTAAWSPIFGVVAGVVTEAGGMLSHPATLAREYGLPAVLALPGATANLREGEVVTVDGGAGTVRLAQGREPGHDGRRGTGT